MRVSEVPNVARRPSRQLTSINTQTPQRAANLDAAAALPVSVPSCHNCGAPASVHVLSRYERGNPVIRRLCLGCSEQEGERILARALASARFRPSVVVATIGVALGLMAVLADDFTWSVHAGFGWRQWGGAALASVFVFLGALVGVDFLLLAGVFLFAGCVSADWLGLSRVPGFGWKQQLLLMAGAAVVGAALCGRLTGLLRWLRNSGPGSSK